MDSLWTPKGSIDALACVHHLLIELRVESLCWDRHVYRFVDVRFQFLFASFQLVFG